MRSTTASCFRAACAFVVTVLALTDCGQSDKVVTSAPTAVAPGSVLQLPGEPPPNQREQRPIVSVPTLEHTAGSSEEIIARAVASPLTVSVTKATTWTTRRTTVEPIFGGRLNKPDEDVCVIALEGTFRNLHPSPPNAILPDTVSMVISLVSVATGEVVATATYPAGHPPSLAILGTGTDVPIPAAK